jgi:hypothetical protein
MSEFKFPTEMVELPSKGLLYPKESPLATGKIEMKYMTAKEEDILTNQSYIQKGIVIDKLLQSLIVTPINYDDLLIGDKNAILVAARVLGYGKDYEFMYRGEKVTIDLSLLESKFLDTTLIKNNENEFTFKLPNTDNTITFKLLTHKDERLISDEIEGLKKITKDFSPDLSTRLKYMILSVNGNTDKKAIREFVDNYLLARDSRALREYIRTIQPDVELKFNFNGPDGLEEGVNIPIGVNFLYPDLGI